MHTVLRSTPMQLVAVGTLVDPTTEKTIMDDHLSLESITDTELMVAMTPLVH